MGLTEFGPNINGGDGSYDLRRLVNNVRSKYPEYVFAHMWHSWPGNEVAYVDNHYTWDLFNDDWVISRESISLGEGNEISGEYRIRNVWTGNYLASSSNLARQFVYSWRYDPSWYSIRWHIEPTGAVNEYRLRNSWRVPGQPFNYLHSSTTQNNVQIYAWEDQPWTWQQWIFEEMSENTYRIKNKQSNLFLNNNADQTVRGYEDQINWTSQQWVLEPTTS